MEVEPIVTRPLDSGRVTDRWEHEDVADSTDQRTPPPARTLCDKSTPPPLPQDAAASIPTRCAVASSTDPTSVRMTSGPGTRSTGAALTCGSTVRRQRTD